MKKILLSLLLACMFFTANAARQGIMIDNVEQRVDTLVHKVVGPGNTYMRLELPGLPVRAYMMIIDRNNPYNKIETFLGKDSIVGMERVTDACARKSYEGHDAYCGVNANFFNIGSSYPSGTPIGGSVEGGQVQRETDNGYWTKCAAFDVDGVPFMDRMIFKGKVISAKHGQYNFERVNHPSDGLNMTFFNRYAGAHTCKDKYYGSHTGLQKTEVFIKPVEGQKWGTNIDVKCVVVRKVTNLGYNLIGEGESVISGVNDAKDYLDKFQPGDEVTIRTELHLENDKVFPNIHELVCGNALIMKNGELCNSNNEDYNIKPYPRTVVGCSKDKRWIYMIVNDGKGQYRGSTTSEVCQILKHYGAWDAVGMDGGGSATMVVNKKVMNWTSDGHERAVGNGFVVVQTAPTDSTIARIRPLDTRLILPLYGTAKPIALGYNQYDVLLSDNVEGVTYTCDPQIGHIDENGTFVAKGEVAGGYLTMHYNGLTAKLPVEIVNVSNFKITYEKIIMDDKRPYEIEVSTEIDGKSYTVTPKIFNWKSENTDICSVDDNGIIMGHKDGDAVVNGTFGESNNNINISVQIPKATNMPVNYPTFPTDWKLKQTGGTDLAIAPLENGFKLDYTGNGAARGAYISVERPMVLWSLPESVRIKVNPGDATVKKISMNAENALGERIASWVFTNTAVEKNKESVYELQLSDWCDPKVQAIYPIKINSIRFDMGVSKKGNKFMISVPAFEAVYPQFGGVSSDIIPSSCINVYPNPVKAGEAFLVAVDGQASVEVFALNGVKAMSMMVDETSAVSTQGLTAGIYFVKIADGTTVKTAKLIVE